MAENLLRIRRLGGLDVSALGFGAMVLSPAHIQENLAAARVELPDGVLERLDAILARTRVEGGTLLYGACGKPEGRFRAPLPEAARRPGRAQTAGAVPLSSSSGSLQTRSRKNAAATTPAPARTDRPA